MEIPIIGQTVPIVGQTKLNSWFLVVSLTCPCGQVVTIHGPIGPEGAVVCSCRKAYIVSGLPRATADGGVHIPIASQQV